MCLRDSYLTNHTHLWLMSPSNVHPTPLQFYSASPAPTTPLNHAQRGATAMLKINESCHIYHLDTSCHTRHVHPQLTPRRGTQLLQTSVVNIHYTPPYLHINHTPPYLHFAPDHAQSGVNAMVRINESCHIYHITWVMSHMSHASTNHTTHVTHITLHLTRTD